MANYILICTDWASEDGVVKAAIEVANARLAATRWPLYRNTRNRLSMETGDRVVIYAGGVRPGKKLFHATANVLGKVQASRSGRQELSALEGNEPAIEWLSLTEANRLTPSVPIANLLDSLSFIPVNRSRWGVAMMGGVRRISDADWNVIVKSKDLN